MTTDTLRLILEELGIRAGYGQRLRAYNFRRGQAQKLDGEHLQSRIDRVVLADGIIDRVRSIGSPTQSGHGPFIREPV